MSVLSVLFDRALERGERADLDGWSVAPRKSERALEVQWGWRDDGRRGRVGPAAGSEIPALELPTGWRAVEQAPGYWLALPGAPWTVEIGGDDLCRDDDWRPCLVIDATERRAFVRCSFGTGGGIPFDEYYGRVASFDLPSGFDADSVSSHLAAFDLELFAEAWAGETHDAQGNLRGEWDDDRFDVAASAMRRHIEAISVHCTPALTVRQVLEEALSASGPLLVAEALLGNAEWLGWHDEAIVANRADAIEVGREWLRDHPEAIYRTLMAERPADVAQLVELSASLLEADPDAEDEEELGSLLLEAAPHFEAGSPAAMLAQALGLREAA